MKDFKQSYSEYIAQLEGWYSFDPENKKLGAVLKYISKGHLMNELFEHKVLLQGEDGLLVFNPPNKSLAPPVYSVVAGDVYKAFCRFRVEIPGEDETATFKDRTMFESWIKYCDSKDSSLGLCYATGKSMPLAKYHSKYIRNTGDGAKLISSNDESNFTFRGRFKNAGEACGISSEVSHKAHSALKWLLSRQGYNKYGHSILAWSTGNLEIPNPVENDIDSYDEELSLKSLPVDTAQNYAIRLKKKIEGYRQKLHNHEDINVISFDSATPGRLSIIYYRELGGGEYLRRLEGWYNSCSWLKKAYFKADSSKKEVGFSHYIIGSPSLIEIVYAAYGIKADDKIKKSTITRLLPCIVDGVPLPVDIVVNAVARVSNRPGFQTDDKDKNETGWNKALETTCALYKKYMQKEDYKMALDQDRNTRDYLYGRLLAVAENLENWALKSVGENRPTTAGRYFSQFAAQPYKTWSIIFERLQPYIMKLGPKTVNEIRMIDEIISKFKTADFLNNQRLSGEYLLGYHNQRQFFNERMIKSSNSEGEE